MQEDVTWIYLAEYRDHCRSRIINLRSAKNTEKFLASLRTISFIRNLTIELERIGSTGGPCGFFIIGFLEKPNSYQMLNENFAPESYVFGSVYENVCFIQNAISFVRKPNFKVRTRSYSELLLRITAVCQLLNKHLFILC